MSQDTHALSGAYALDALSPEEAERFERHLEGCDPCRAEVNEFREVAARLGARTAEKPPPALREKVLTHADRTRQDPPPPRLATHDTGAVVTPLHRRRWVGLLAAAAVVLVAGVVGLQVIDRNDEPQEPALAAPVTQVFEADDAQSLEVPLDEGGALRVAVSKERGEMAVDARELPDPGKGRVYQLWTGHGGEMINAGVLAPTDTGAAMPLPSRGDTVNVTVEPAGGSDQPTSAPIVTVDPADL